MDIFADNEFEHLFFLYLPSPPPDIPIPTSLTISELACDAYGFNFKTLRCLSLLLSVLIVNATS